METPRILIIDDDACLRKSLVDVLSVKGYEPLPAENGRRGLSLMAETPVNVALIDLKLPDIPGIDVLERVKAMQPSTEAIILTGHAALDTAIEATNKGAFSYLQKPYDMDQLLLHIRRALEKQDAEAEISRRAAELEQVNAELKTLYEEAKTSSLHDPLTGLSNRRFLQVQMDKLRKMVERYKTELSAIMLDIDHFKRYNDTYGHVEGDRLLIRIADIITKHARSADYAFRYGGEEFLLLLPETDLGDACTMAERLRAVVESGTGVTISLGVASCTTPARENIIEKADEALYKAKQNGRNRVEAALPRLKRAAG